MRRDYAARNDRGARHLPGHVRADAAFPTVFGRKEIPEEYQRSLRSIRDGGWVGTGVGGDCPPKPRTQYTKGQGMSRKNHGNRPSFPVLPTVMFPPPSSPRESREEQGGNDTKAGFPGSANLPARQRILIETVPRERASKKKMWIPLWDWYDIKTSKLLYA